MWDAKLGFLFQTVFAINVTVEIYIKGVGEFCCILPYSFSSQDVSSFLVLHIPTSTLTPSCVELIRTVWPFVL